MSHVKNTGHGHVYPREDGVRARCGGPGLCSECSRDLVEKMRSQMTQEEFRRLYECDWPVHPEEKGHAKP